MIDKAARMRARLMLLALIVGAVTYKVLNEIGQDATSLMFVGLPAVLAVMVTFSPSAKSAAGTAVKAVTLILLLSGILFVEGAVCILLSAPLFLGIAAGVGAIIDLARRKKLGRTARVSLMVPLIALSMQGFVPGTSGPRGVVGSAESVVSTSPDQIRQALENPASFDRELPALFRFGQFPRPLSSVIVDEQLVIDFEMGEPMFHKLSLDNAHHAAPSQLVLKIVESSPGRLVFEAVSDTTMMSHWAALESSVVEWTPTARGTHVKWTLRFERKLDPVWYFGPMQTYAANKAAEYLVETIIR